MEDLNKEKIVKEIITHRRSVRKFNEKTISKKDIMDIVEAGVYAPSGSNWQTQRFLVITNKEHISQIIFSKTQKEKLESASAIIMIFADTSKCRKDNEEHIWELLKIKDCAASMQNMQIMATSKNIASCWISFENRMSKTRVIKYKSIEEILKPYNIPETYEVHDFLVLGYTNILDELGYPKGYGRHGWINEKISRKNTDEYILGWY